MFPVHEVRPSDSNSRHLLERNLWTVSSPITFVSLSLFKKVSNKWNEEARCAPRHRYFREFILVAVFSRPDDRPSYLGPRGKSAKSRKMPHENIGLPSPLLSPSPKTWRERRRWRHFCGEGRWWKNSFRTNFREVVFQASRATLTTRW